MKFTKMHGIGNDYIYVNGMSEDVCYDEEYIQKISDRHTGIGSDGMIVILDSEHCDFKMRMFNKDGSEGKMCGNGIRCFAKFVYDQGLTNKDQITVETLGGNKIVYLHIVNGEVISAKVDMGQPIFECAKIPVAVEHMQMIDAPLTIHDHTYQVTCLSMGNPHCVIFVNDVMSLDLDKIGPYFEHSHYFPESVNTEFVEMIDEDTIRMRVWERGSKETQACGTGACASAVAAMLLSPCKRKLTVQLLGGELEIEWAEDNHVYMSGPAVSVYHGEID